MLAGKDVPFSPGFEFSAHELFSNKLTLKYLKKEIIVMTSLIVIYGKLLSKVMDDRPIMRSGWPTVSK